MRRSTYVDMVGEWGDGGGAGVRTALDLVEVCTASSAQSRLCRFDAQSAQNRLLEGCPSIYTTRNLVSFCQWQRKG